MRAIALLALATVALCACDVGGRFNPGSRGEIAHRKPGLWQLTLARTYLPRSTVFLDCVDRRSDSQWPLVAKVRPPDCEKWPAAAQSGGVYVGSASCRGSKWGFTISGNSGTSYTIDDWRILQHEEGRWPAGTTLKRHAVWLYKGDCPSNIPPGQEQRPDGDIEPIGAEVVH